MPFDPAKVDLIIQYSLLCAGEEDDYLHQQLGPIHIIKYVYLADLLFAKENNGSIYTGAKWIFYKFGPWAQEVNQRIESALIDIKADKKVFESKYEDRDEWVRWRKHDYDLLISKERCLPSCITRFLKREIHKYGADTPILLDFVYKTDPMLHAAPKEELDFSVAIPDDTHEKEKFVSAYEQLSEKKKRKLKKQIELLRENRKKRGVKHNGLVIPPSPKYDEIYDQGVAWLDGLAGLPLPIGEKVVEFSEDVWKSSTRKDKDVS